VGAEEDFLLYSFDGTTAIADDSQTSANGFRERNAYRTAQTVNPARKRFLEYDAHGNVVWIEAEPSGDGSAREFKYDHENRLVWHEASSGATTTYAYDALGRRIEKAVNQKIARYIYSGSRVIEERDGSGDVLASYVYGRGLDEPVLMRRDVDGDGTPEDYYFHSDDQHNTWFLSDASGQAVEAYAYGSVLEPYVEVDGALVQFPNDFGLPVFLDPATGEPRPVAFTDTGIPTFADTGQPYESEFGNPFLFNGREWDPEFGFYHYRTRHLDPLTGRFTSPDPLGPVGDRPPGSRGRDAREPSPGPHVQS